MACLRASYAVCVLILSLLLASQSFGQTPPLLRVDEQQIKFRLDSHPTLALPVVNTSDKTIAGDFRLELLDSNNKVESFVRGKFQEKPGTTVEKIEWPLDYLANISPSSLGWRRLHYSFVPRPELGGAPAEGLVQLSRVLAGIFEVRMTAASKAKPGNKFPVRVRVDDPSNGKPLHGTAVDLVLQLGDDYDNAIKHTVTTDYSGYAVYSFDLPKEIQADEGTVKAEAKRGPYSEDVELTFDLRSKGASYYIPWPQAEATRTENFKSGDTRALKLKVDFDRHEARVGEALACRVEAERIGFAGYGMMIAEIGLPPGAEVDRESLEEAKRNGVDGYEVQPDRVVFYLWPSAGGSKFQFIFRPRFGISAMSAPSVLYDYYNPEAIAAVLPLRFNVQ